MSPLLLLTPHCVRRLPIAQVVLGCLWLVAATRPADARADEPTGSVAGFPRQLEELAAKCEQLEMPAQARITRGWVIPRDPGRQYVFLPPASDTTRPPDNAERLVRQWHEKLTQIRSQQAERLFEQAREQLDAGRPGASYRLLHEVLHEDPDHAEARRILDYRRLNDVWRRAGREPQARVGTRDFALLRWRRRRHWIVDSEHFQILTSHSSQAGLDLARQLEELHDVWRQVFFGFWADQRWLAARFDGGQLGRARRQHQVILFRDRQQYLETLQRVEPQIAKTVGYYVDHQQRAYFFAGQGSDASTWFHEATHQLFQETGSAVRDPGSAGNFWVVEGAALYMESLRRHQGYCTVGGFDANRLQYARYRALNERFYKPLAELVALDRETLQHDPHLQRLYSQAAGLMHFLMMDDQAGRYRDGAIRYLRDVYQGRAAAGALSARTSSGPAELDAAYHHYLGVTDRDLAFLSPQVENLCLGHTQVSDAGLAGLADCEHIRWLDLAATRIGDATVQRLAQLSRVRQLNLEGTQITDQALETVGRLDSLEELDLSGTGITDQGLRHLADLRGLQILWLTGTRVSDGGLQHLAGLRKLEMLDLDNTQVTPAGRRGLRQQLPALK